VEVDIGESSAGGRGWGKGSRSGPDMPYDLLVRRGEYLGETSKARLKKRGGRLHNRAAEIRSKRKANRGRSSVGSVEGLFAGGGSRNKKGGMGG